MLGSNLKSLDADFSLSEAGKYFKLVPNSADAKEFLFLNVEPAAFALNKGKEGALVFARYIENIVYQAKDAGLSVKFH